MGRHAIGEREVPKMGRSRTEHPPEHDAAGTRRGSESTTVEELAIILRATPYYEWWQLRPGVGAAPLEVFTAAADRVQQAWSEHDRRAEIRRALTAAATEIVLAMPDSCDDGELLVSDDLTCEHLRKAIEALHAAQQLSPSIDSEAALSHRSVA
jgi:predicted lipid-binding transport protein (Tim44 family)